MTISVKKIVAISMAISILSVAGCTLVLRTLMLMEIVGPTEAETLYWPVKLTIRLDKYMYRWRETVNFTINITNISKEKMLMAYSHLPKVDFAAYDSSSKLIYTFSGTHGFPGIGAGMVLGPSESYIVSPAWDQQKFAEERYKLQPVWPGIYYITGLVGTGLYYLGPENKFNPYESNGYIRIETPKIKIQIL